MLEAFLADCTYKLIENGYPIFHKIIPYFSVYIYDIMMKSNDSTFGKSDKNCWNPIPIKELNNMKRSGIPINLIYPISKMSIPF